MDPAVIVTESDGRGGAVTYGIRWREYWARAARRKQGPVDQTTPRVGNAFEITHFKMQRRSTGLPLLPHLRIGKYSRAGRLIRFVP